jgi:hypothetical protein
MAGHTYEYPDSFCECGVYFARPEVEYDHHLLEVTGDETQLPLAAVMTPVPNKPKTPLRSFRIGDELYEAAQAKAADRGETVSDVVRRALERYVRRP